MNSLLALSLISIIVIHLMSAPLWRKLVLLAAVPPIVLVANSIRIASVLLVAQFLSPKIALDMFVHGFSDVIVYLAALMILVLLAGALARGRAPSLEPRPD
jgi:exosortase/archaeosortase family protein